MLRDKIEEGLNLLKEEYANCNINIIGTKYTKYGFASVYYKVTDCKGSSIYVPAIITPTEGSTDYVTLLSFFDELGLCSYIVNEGVLDIHSFIAFIQYLEYRRFIYSGKKALHKDLAEYNLMSDIKKLIREKLDMYDGLVRIMYNPDSHSLLVTEVDEDDEYFDEARELLGV